jgi:hypothetical protein
MDVDVAMDYLGYVCERHRVWEARQAGAPQPWTLDPILSARKFTNDYRVLDPGSQFVFDLADAEPDPEVVLFRLFLYRYTNEPVTWRYLREFLGDGYPTPDHPADLIVEALHRWRDEMGKRVFSGAYIILPQPNRPGDKVEQAVSLAYRWIEAHGRDFLAATSQQKRYDILRREYGVGPFMAMQILTDWGYTPQCGEDREGEFIVPGPGCIKGAKYVAPAWPVMQTLEWAHALLQHMPGAPLLHGRRLSLMDVQNTFCEFSKYHRYQRKPVKAEPYRPAHPGPQPAPVLPAHWLDT